MRACLVILTWLSFSGSFSQDRSVTDSLLAILDTRSVTDSLAFEIHRKLGFQHPEPLEAVTHGLKALHISEKTGNLKNKIRALTCLSTAYRLLGNRSKGMETSFKALHLSDSLKWDKQRAGLLLIIAENYTEDENYDEALVFFHQSLSLYRSLKDTFRVATLFVNLGETYRLANKMDSAARWFGKALHLNKRIKNQVIEAYASGNLGMALSTIGDFEQASAYLDKAISILTVFDDASSIIVFKSEQAKIAFAGGKYLRSIKGLEGLYQEAVALSLRDQSRDLSQQLASWHEQMGNYKRALTYQKLFHMHQDSLVNAANIKKVAQARSKYELSKREVEIRNLELENRLQQVNIEKIAMLTLLSLVLLALSIGILVLVYRNYVAKKRHNAVLEIKNRKIKKRANEKVILHEEMHHRIKNNLQLIASIMGLHARSVEDKALSEAIVAEKTRVESMTLIHQHLYPKSGQTEMSLRTYVNGLVENLKTVYQKELLKLEATVADVHINVDDCIPLGLIVNEAICNAVKYRSQDGVSVELSVTDEESHVLLEIEDNGPGFSVSDVTGFGSRLMQTLAAQMSGNLSMTSSSSGTKLSLIFLNQMESSGLVNEEG